MNERYLGFRQLAALWLDEAKRSEELFFRTRNRNYDSWATLRRNMVAEMLRQVELAEEADLAKEN